MGIGPGFLACEANALPRLAISFRRISSFFRVCDGELGWRDRLALLTVLASDLGAGDLRSGARKELIALSN